MYTCKDSNALNYSRFGRHKESKCKYENKVTETIKAPLPKTENIFQGDVCPKSQIISQNMKAPAQNGKYHPYTKDTVTDAKILQAHMNRLGFNAGDVDGIIGPLTDAAIKRMQVFLGTDPDGYVGPNTRALINKSCKNSYPDSPNFEKMSDTDILSKIDLIQKNINSMQKEIVLLRNMIFSNAGGR